ncbi:hypothetical protein ACIQGZ_09290 [Streptomyces sp. NPDC092296]|uniref:hypothetical protein n=1 Tax=Streptomyces sp. NPDC092296 TaxID=3366012 RepID=UPI0037F97DFB
MTVFDFLLIMLFSWMAWSVRRMHHLPSWRRRLPLGLLAASAVCSLALTHVNATALPLRWLPALIALTSWAVSLFERKSAAQRPAGASA